MRLGHISDKVMLKLDYIFLYFAHTSAVAYAIEFSRSCLYKQCGRTKGNVLSGNKTKFKS